MPPHAPARPRTPPSTARCRLRIGILGFGNFGQFLARTFVIGNTVFASSRSDYTDVAAQMGLAAYYCNANEMLEKAK